MLRRIDVDGLRVGMFVCRLDRSWLETPFFRHRFLIRNRKQLEQLRAACRQVTIDTEQGLDLPPAANITAEELAPAQLLVAATEEQAHSLGRELVTAGGAHREASGVLEQVLDDVRLGRGVDTQRTRQVVKGLTESVVREPSALLCLTQLKTRSRYAAQHSVNVCIFTLVFARHLGLPGEVMHDLGLGALLLDVGKARIPVEILDKPDKLTPAEFALVKRHTLYGRRILEQHGVSDLVLEVVSDHHERIDGSGYPRGLKGKEIGLYARIVGLVDVYDAITSARVYGDPVSTLEAMRLLYQWRYQQFDHRLVEKFIQCLGVYPAGSLVEMDSGEVGVVVRVNARNRTRPVVRLLLDRSKRPLAEAPLVDLTRPMEDGASMTIGKVLDPLAWQDRLGEMWNEETLAANV
ncbi:HD-GYP domain-containing protein [Endothiovibrio diazotrophicus]